MPVSRRDLVSDADQSPALVGPVIVDLLHFVVGYIFIIFLICGDGSFSSPQTQLSLFHLLHVIFAVLFLFSCWRAICFSSVALALFAFLVTIVDTIIVVTRGTELFTIATFDTCTTALFFSDIIFVMTALYFLGYSIFSLGYKCREPIDPESTGETPTPTKTSVNKARFAILDTLPRSLPKLAARAQDSLLLKYGAKEYND